MSQEAKDVLTTIGYPGFVRALYNRTGDLSKDFTHAVLGVVTESVEYLNATDKVNAIEEIGDLMFYIEAFRQVLNDMSPIVDEDFEKAYAMAIASFEGEVVLVDLHTEWLDLAKRWVGYGKAPTIPTSSLMGEMAAMATITVAGGMLEDDDSMPQIMLANVDKLLKRYNGLKFDSERAVNRDLPAERSVLESHSQ